MAASGIDNPEEINRSHIYQRIDEHVSKSYYRLYPYIPESSLLNEESIPKNWKRHVAMADAENFRPRFEVVYVDED